VKSGSTIVITAPLTESIDHAGYFIQMALASLPVWMERFIDKKYPNWREVKRFGDGSAKVAPAGVRALEKILQTEFGEESVKVCYPDDLDQFIGPETRVVAVSTHNPLGVTFAAGVYASMFGTSKRPINSHYAELMFEKIRLNPYRDQFNVIVGGSGGWQIVNTDAFDRLGVDCVVDGRAESKETISLFRDCLQGKNPPRELQVQHPSSIDDIVLPDKPTTFGVVEMTTGCGRRCKFCMPDLNPQLTVPKEQIMNAVKANVKEGIDIISLATEDMFIWGQVGTDVPFYFPNREALVDLFRDVAHYPGVKHHMLSHSTMAPAVVDPELIRQLSDTLLDKSPLRFPTLSNHPEKKALSPLIGLETGSVRMAKKVMPAKGAPFKIDDWPSIVINGLETLNANNWFPVMTLMVGNPGETDEDVKATLDLIYEMERRGLFAFLVPSIFTPLEGTRMEKEKGTSRTIDMSPLQWQLIMRCWKMNLVPGSTKWWAPYLFRAGSLVLWATRLRKTNGPNFFWPLMNFAGAGPEEWILRAGNLYSGGPIRIKSRAELLSTIRPNHIKYIRSDTLPAGQLEGLEIAV
jgi:radical SAM superfamily enzyme YgiQ (UPF0313 family)